jgi:hypothetical protein
VGLLEGFYGGLEILGLEPFDPFAIELPCGFNPGGRRGNGPERENEDYLPVYENRWASSDSGKSPSL